MLAERAIPFRALFDAAPDGLLACDARGVVVLANHQAEQMFGYDRDELLGASIELLVPEALRGRHREWVADFGRAPRVRPMGSKLELRGQCKDGRELAVEISLSPLEAEGGLLILAGIRNVSERWQLRHDRDRATEFLVSAVAAVEDAFLLFDEDDRLMMMNRAAGELLALTAHGVPIGETFEQLLRVALVAGFYDLGEESAERWYAQRLAYHLDPVGALDLRTRAGRHLRVAERRIAGGGTVMTIVDITDDAVRAEELRVARVSAEAASTAKSEFLSSMSHELRTPLNAILGFAQLLERDRKQPLSERQVARLEQIVRGGEHLLHLIDDVLDLSRIDAGRVSIAREAHDLVPLLDEVVRGLRQMAVRSGIHVELLPVPSHAPRVVADRTRLAQILMNFGSNAIKYGKRDGHVILRADVRDDQVRIAVCDDGIGIAEDKRARIFDPFQRAGQEAGPIEGTGIGLTISKRLAALMDIAIGFESEVGRGSTFWVDVPGVGAAELAAPTTRMTARPSSHARRHLVVYVEDNPSNIAFMRDLLEELPNIELLTAPSAELGLELIRGCLPEVVIMDVNLPGMSGLDAVKQLRDAPDTRALPVIGLSAAALPRDRARAEQAGFYRYLTKPVNVDELIALLGQLLEGDAHAISGYGPDR